MHVRIIHYYPILGCEIYWEEQPIPAHVMQKLEQQHREKQQQKRQQQQQQQHRQDQDIVGTSHSGGSLSLIGHPGTGPASAGRRRGRAGLGWGRGRNGRDIFANRYRYSPQPQSAQQQEQRERPASAALPRVWYFNRLTGEQTLDCPDGFLLQTGEVVRACCAAGSHTVDTRPFFVVVAVRFP